MWRREKRLHPWPWKRAYLREPCDIGGNLASVFQTPRDHPMQTIQVSQACAPATNQAMIIGVRGMVYWRGAQEDRWR